MKDENNIYLMLGLSDHASTDDVKKSYRRYAKENHPDLFPGNKIKEDKFKEMTLAYHNWELIENAVSTIKKIKGQKNTREFNGYIEFCKKWTKKNSVDYRA
jgi:curved DNA-binding protein CbpA